MSQSQTVEFNCEDNFYLYQTLLMGLDYPYDFSACTDFNNGGLIITHVPLTEVSGSDTLSKGSTVSLCHSQHTMSQCGRYSQHMLLLSSRNAKHISTQLGVTACMCMHRMNDE